MPAEPAVAATRRRPSTASRSALLAACLSMVGAGAVLLSAPAVGPAQAQHAADDALRTWRAGGFRALVGAPPVTARSVSARGVAAPDAGDAPATCGASVVGGSAYALVSFPSLQRYGYASVAGDTAWDGLSSNAMVHYRGSAAPGERGNVIIGFHREPRFRHIDDLRAGDTVDVQDRSCRVFHYTVVQRWELAPQAVTELGGSDGFDMTLVTCTPWWRDDHRLVWRARLTG